MDRDQILSANAVRRLIASGKHIVISEGRVLQLDGWLDKHPGGKLAIMHMVGRDATDEMNIYHSTETLATLHRYRVGFIVGHWTNLKPPIRGGVHLLTSDEDTSDDASDIDDLSDASTLCTRTTSLNIDPARDEALRERIALGSDLDGQEDGPLQVPSSGQNRGSRKARIQITSEAYIDKVMQGEIDDNLRDYPSLDETTQRAISSAYRQLHQEVKDNGLYRCRYFEYAKELTRYLSIFALFCTALRCGWYLTSAAFLGLFWHQIMFTAHDAGHRGITHNFVADNLIGLFIADFCCGLSLGWWKSSHNVHHIITNHPEHDPDIQNVPLFATCPSFFKSLRSTYYDFTFVWDKVADFAVAYQYYTYYPVMAVARFNLYALSMHYLFTSPRPQSRITSWVRPTEIAFIVCYWLWFGYGIVWLTLPDWTTRILFVLLSHMITMPLHVQITLSHWAMPTADLGDAESFPQRQLRTTMDVDCPEWLDFIHGGLQFQAVHHLFPQVPRHNLRKVQSLVRNFCKETGIKYTIYGFKDGNKQVLGRLAEVADQMDMMLQCQKYMAETRISGLH
ncbi:hypothetical protein PV11_10098 [Exophiala sideris]|uniref:Delta 8-(E)-sphingolipid desaturase n=1 Tax=Exophiala sideris TaxID=1016849 RepID=A0A0D1WTB9_9EURO|nr:hypothetical protein PV11_10098 [Exophiala sideris]